MKAIKLPKHLNIVVLGGGTGLSTVLKSLKVILQCGRIDLTITAGCAASDNGGDTGNLVDEYGFTGFIGDFMKCLLALCPMPNVVEACNYRIKNGSRKGQVLRNSILTDFIWSLVGPDGDYRPVFQELFGWFQINPHRVFPVSIMPTTLYAEVEIDERNAVRIATIKGQTQIALYHKRSDYNPEKERIRRVIQEPQVPGYPPLIEAIDQADVIVVAMGSLFTSIIPSLLPTGIKEAISGSEAKIVHPLNLMIHDGESRDLQGHQFLEKIESVIGKQCDHVLYSFGDAPIPAKVVQQYKDARMVSYFPGIPQEGKLVYDDSLLDKRVICTPLRSYTNGTITHDVELLAKELEKIFVRI